MIYTVVRKGKHGDTPEWHTLHQPQHRHPRHSKSHSITWRQPFLCAKSKQSTRYLCNTNKPPADKRQLETSHYQSVPTNQGLCKVMSIIGGAKDAALSQRAPHLTQMSAAVEHDQNLGWPLSRPSRLGAGRGRQSPIPRRWHPTQPSPFTTAWGWLITTRSATNQRLPRLVVQMEVLLRRAASQ